ncbi:MAG: carbamoyl phosphate synthase-like protein [Parcubacteria group bacterium ADurb.Bin316]|nr:MAG: carbamoyl phosphate synthase-like protein [Parcubacteria group bacterium ADurb.Bin316]HOZ56467.1 ATP-grasp domain-containing protein [bacterium]
MIAIVLDGQLQSALAVVRSLGEKEIKVFCGSHSRLGMSLFSTYCSKRFYYTSPRISEKQFVDDVAAITKSVSDDVIIYCFSDETYLPISRCREYFSSSVKFILPAASDVETAFDKEKTLRLAQQNDVPIPKTYFISSADEVKKLTADIEYPAVIKPKHSCSWHNDRGYFGSVSLVDSPVDLIAEYEKIYQKTKELPLIQEYIAGEECGAFFLFDHGKVITEFAHQRIRSISPYGGASTVRKSIVMPEDMKDYSWRLLKNLNWHGPAMVEFKRDGATDILKLMEINGRWWGSLPLAVYSGVDFPYLFYKMANGKIIESPQYKADIISRHLLADIKNLLTIFSGKNEIKSLPYPEKKKALKEFCKIFGKNLYYDVESLADPIPFYMEILDIISKFKK